MNLLEFLKAVDHVAQEMSKEELIRWIHEIARTLPEKDREGFLGRICRSQGIQNADRKQEKTGIPERYAYFKEKLQKMEVGELCLTGSLNEEYDDWYNSMADEFLYEDPQGVIRVIEDACAFVRQCTDQKEYQIGAEIAERLMRLELTIDGEYQEYSDATISVKELQYFHLSKMSYTRFAADAVYAAYCASELQERPEAVYRMIENSGSGVTMEQVMQSGEELPQTEEFMQLWMTYLGSISSGPAPRLLKEAAGLMGDPQQVLESARKYHDRHPELYKQYLEMNPGKVPDEELYEAGQEALDVIGQQYIVRSETALLLSRIALKLGKTREAEKCWLEAFRSDTNVVNYLRLRMECEDFENVKADIQDICLKLCRKSIDDRYVFQGSGGLRENRASKITVHFLSFLEGRFSDVAEHAMNEKEAFGWSFTFMKSGLALFLLLLYEDHSLGKGCEEMCQRAAEAAGFSKEAYEQGLLKKVKENSQEWFWKCFCRWKESVSLSDSEKQKYLHWVEMLVEKRVRGIMEGNHRKYYEECAGFVAAVGEVRESRGEINGRQNAMWEYKQMYSRRSAFHRELRAYGMKD